VLQPGDAGFDALHAYFLDRLLPVCTQLLDAVFVRWAIVCFAFSLL
jgi:hypothetical protein